MCNDDDDDTNANTIVISPERILELAREWGTHHGRLWATDLEVREAVLAGIEVDWFDCPDFMWQGIGINLEDLDQLSLELRIEAENAAGCAAQAEGERCSRMPEDEFRDLICADELFDDDMCPSE